MAVYTLPAHQRHHHYPVDAPTDCYWCRQETNRRIAQMDACLAVTPGPVTQADRDARRATTALGWLLITLAAVLALFAGIAAAALWPGTPYAAMGAVPAVALIAYAIHRAITPKENDQ